MMRTTTTTMIAQGTGDLLDNAQAMARLGLSASQLARLRTTRRIAYSKRGGRLWYAAAEVERVLKAFDVPALRPVVDLGGPAE